MRDVYRVFGRCFWRRRFHECIQHAIVSEWKKSGGMYCTFDQLSCQVYDVAAKSSEYRAAVQDAVDVGTGMIPYYSCTMMLYEYRYS